MTLTAIVSDDFMTHEERFSAILDRIAFLTVVIEAERSCGMPLNPAHAEELSGLGQALGQLSCHANL